MDREKSNDQNASLGCLGKLHCIKTLVEITGLLVKVITFLHTVQRELTGIELTGIDFKFGLRDCTRNSII